MPQKEEHTYGEPNISLDSYIDELEKFYQWQASPLIENSQSEKSPSDETLTTVPRTDALLQR